MVDMKRYDGEDENAYIWRVCENKEFVGTWQDVCELLNNELGYEYNESKYRKMYQSFIKLFNIVKDKYDNNEELDRLEQKKQEAIKERKRLCDVRSAYNKQLRDSARLESRLDNLENAIKDFGKVEYNINEKAEINSDNDLFVMLSDLHIGSTFNNYFGEYDSKIAKERLNKYLNKILEIQKIYNSENCYVSLQGDMISGNIHSTIAITNQENVIEQIKLASELITGFISELSKHFTNVYVASVSGNHSRLTRKEDALKDERLDDLIIWYIRTALSHKTNVAILDNFEETFSVMEIRGNVFVNVHGDYDKFSKVGVNNLISFLGIRPYAITFGHLHTCAMMEEQGVKLIRGGSLAGSGDDYTIQGRMIGKASQMICVVNKEGIQSYCEVVLS